MDNIVFSLQHTGGISVYWYEILKRLCSDPAFEVIMLEYTSAKHNMFRQLLDVKSRSISLDGVMPIQIARFLPAQIPFDVSADAVFHSSYYRSPSKKLKTIVTIHDWIYKIFGQGLKDYIHVKQQVDAVKASDTIVCISKSTLKDTIKYGNIDNKNIHVVYNGYSEIYRQNISVHKKKQVIFVGSRQPYKNFDKAVQSVSLVRDKDVSLAIVGPPLSSDEIIMLEQYIPSRYNFYGRVSNEKLNQLYNESISLLYLSEYEGFGIPVAEAMAAGCPVICLNRSSLPEVAGDAGILLDGAKPEAIANNIDEMIRNQLFYQDLVNSGLKQSGNFSWDITYQQLRKIYLS